jgi:putative hemolysin
VLKAIAGNLLDAKAGEPSMEKRGEDEFLVHGGMSLSDVQSGLELQDLPSGPFVTFAGFVVSLFGRMPKAGEAVAWNDWNFEVFEMDGLRIRKVLARRCTRSPMANAGHRSSSAYATNE